MVIGKSSVEVTLVTCCEHIDFDPRDFENIKNEKCFVKKSDYMIEKVVNEIVLAKLRRESVGKNYA